MSNQITLTVTLADGVSTTEAVTALYKILENGWTVHDVVFGFCDDEEFPEIITTSKNGVWIENITIESITEKI